MTPMLGGRNLINPLGDDIKNSKERWMSPKKTVRPGDYKQVTFTGEHNEYMQKLIATRKNL